MRCPECKGTDFTVEPKVLPTIAERWKGRKVVREVEDFDENKDDELTCSNCGHTFYRDGESS
jgi:predicted nucleic-acid-binding Zn-ribbon protein